ncbi:PREDICTED: ubiquitin carboxyl-terminal hydrolase 32 [Papilio polytes]|uniref:ubiquitin carboxyl-terminal hydrolase 32 n=1 Tax=Papilio polytes TaxID=76194 RepID=UPI00067663B0|nr:PREDICTED: ubiquitin carboxyl-terminal hydrolase 32 [Papilio polytes]
MGAKDSKPSFISYEDATKRVSESELRRIREAFKRCAGTSGTALSLEAFVHEVLCDGVPYEVAEWMYQACGGTKRGIIFRDLLCGIVVLTKGNLEEKIKFLWTLYVNNQSENGTYIYKRDFARALQIENTSLPVSKSHRSADILTSLFGLGERVTFEQFRSWLLIHKDATVLSKWLLSDRGSISHDLETPTFYQSLAGVTHLEERDIIELEKCFWSLRSNASSGQLDGAGLRALLTPPLPAAALPGVLRALDENRDGHVDFKELCCGLSAACRGPRTERLKFCFKIFDLDRDGVLNKKELIDMVGILCTVANESLKQQNSRASTPSDESEADKSFDPEVVLLNLRDKLVSLPKNGSKPIFQLGPNISVDESGKIEEELVDIKEDSDCESLIASDAALTAEEFLMWAVERAERLLTPLLELVFDVCHVVLGLRPQCRHHERDIVIRWLRRETARGYSVGQFWYLVGSEWWASWAAYTAAGDNCCRNTPRAIDDAIVCDESFTSNSTESMGSLLWRAETSSLGSGSAGSSSGVSSAPAHRSPPHPGPIDNRRLLARDDLKVRTLTGEGGHLRRDVTLAQHRDFELLPDSLWRAMALWYGGPDPLPRQVIRPPNSDVEMELYPLQLKILRHVPSTPRVSAGVGVGAGVGGAGAALYSSVPAAPAPPDRQLAYTAAFSRLATVRQVTEFLCEALGLAREDVRLWSVGGAGGGAGGAGGALLLDDERPSLHDLRLHERDRSRLLLELRNPDLTWPEEIGALSMSGGRGGRGVERRETLSAPDVAGATGLHNLGNTCFMNAALQSVWNTGPLTRYFNSGMHLYEVNTTNPLGTKGALALRYGELCKEVWSCSARSVAPLRVRWCVSRHARGLAGGEQHDAQELLAWLLDALHEDLNRAAPPRALPPPPAPATPTDTPPQQVDTPPPTRPDQELAAEAWAQFTASNDSIMTDLFYGQLKSKVRCDACGHESVRFDTFNMLSLPLPMESFVRCEIRVILLDGSVPVKYGLRVNSEGTYLDLKKKLSELCGLPPECMLVALVSGATISRLPEDGAKLTASGATELFVYEIPAPQHGTHEWGETGAWCGGGGGGGEAGGAACGGAGAGGGAAGSVSVRAASLCMPALFCFKRSRSEILMSQSPPSTFSQGAELGAELGGEGRSHTLPRGAGARRSLTLPPPAPPLSKVKFASSPSDMYKMDEIDGPPIQYLIAVHRKQCRADAFFLPWQRVRPALFGVPLAVAVRAGEPGRELYARVWAQLARLLSPRPPRPPHTPHAHRDLPNHAADCDDSLGYEFPFTLRLVCGSGAWCALCAWPALCRGCALPSDHKPLLADTHTDTQADMQTDIQDTHIYESQVSVDSGCALAGGSPAARAKLQRQSSARHASDAAGEMGCGEVSYLSMGALRAARRRGLLLAIDWEPTALHLRYQATRERACVEHPSVSECGAAGARPVDLASCLAAFTSEERLEQRYHCDHCRCAQPATKKLQLWRAPPILIVHLKRFQYVNNKWIKSQKVVNFPFEDFDPTPYLASVPQETILRHRELKTMRRRSMFVDVEGPISETESENSDDEDSREDSRSKANVERRRESVEVKGRARLQSTSLTATPVTDDNLVDYHQHHLEKDQDPFDLKYKLYAVVSHTGQLHGGHYVAYAHNPSGAWLCYNDSSCRAVSAREVQPAAAYLLFYERTGLEYSRYLPASTNGTPPAVTTEDDDMRNMCVLA